MSWLILSALGACLGNLAIGIFAFPKTQKDSTRFHFALMAFSLSLWATSDFSTQWFAQNNEEALLWVRFSYVGALLMPASFLGFVLTLAGGDRYRKTILLAYSISAILLIALPTPLLVRSVIRQPYQEVPGPLYVLYVSGVIVSFLYGAFSLVRGYRTAEPLHKNQLRYVLVATTVGLVALGIYFLVTYRWKLPPIHYFIEIGVVLTLAYAIIRHHLMDVNVAITRATVFTLVYTFLLGLPLWGAWTWQPQLRELLGPRWWLALWFACGVLSTAAHYANSYMQRRAEERLMAEQRRYQSVLRQAAQGMILIKNMKKLLSLVVHLLTQKVRLKHAAIYLWDEKTKRFYCQAARQWPVKEPPPFAPGDAMVEYINWHRTPVVTEELYLQARGGAKELQGVVASLKNLQAAVLIPSFTEDRCEGFLLLGDKVSGALFSSDDLQVFQVLASQTALAIENAQFYEELKRTQTDLFQTAKMASLGHMAGGMSHQINNRFHVLTILAGTLRSVMKDSDPLTMDKAKLQELWGKAVETLSKLEDNAFRGGDIVKTLLKFSRPSGDYKLLSLAQVVKTARDVAQFRVNLASIDFQEDVPEDLPQVRGDMNQLADSVFNLITNAFDAISKKATMLEDKLLPPAPNDPVPFRGRLWARAYSEKKDDKDYVVLEFQDNGVGMTSAELENIFVPFFTTKATAQKGTGLGLYVIQRIVEQHGGVVNAKSKYGVGTTFTFRLPANTEAAPAGTTSVGETHGEKSAAA